MGPAAAAAFPLCTGTCIGVGLGFVCVCVRRGGLSERSSDVEVVVSQISAGDGVSMGGGWKRDKEGGREERRRDEGWCVPAGCWRE